MVKTFMTKASEKAEPHSNLTEYSVSELSGAVKKAVEENFGHVRVRGELGRVSHPASGHIYLDLKDDKAVLAGVIWKGVAAKLSIQPEQGLEVICTGRLTTYAGQSKYQLVIEHIEPAGVGALMALLEERKRKLHAEGLFAEEKKKPLPYLPAVIGVVTSPSGAVVRDILHRLADRFPRHVLVWPVRVQGETCAEEVAKAIAGFNALKASGAKDNVPRPDVLIIARGGGSLEDLWGFNEEIVARTVAQSDIPVISAIGHETDTTLIDYVADRRAPTPTAAAEMAVPVRAELQSRMMELARRQMAAQNRLTTQSRDRLVGAARALPRFEDMLALSVQRLDTVASRLGHALAQNIAAARTRLAPKAAGLNVTVLNHRLAQHTQRIGEQHKRSKRAWTHFNSRLADRLAAAHRQLDLLSHESVLARGFALVLDEAGAAVRAPEQAPIGTALNIRLAGQRGLGAEVVSHDGARKGAKKSPPRKKTAKKSKTPKADSGQGDLF